ncbi:hypothetical protein XG19_004186 [Salmonella enterica subsp. enterica serovar Gaminara]|nr:hypothetical protein [Salmonella enterica subsp. enterica serovar Gaminara]ECF2939091.1 hypothetical protein [Salmonella enterica subsp. enterica serovar Reading]ECO0313598.1 hypothetical protein [Salmonella enterica subsp. enterica serovar Schwarzengrund]EDP8790010.1 hypothetical protein [Salmonella enterica subsp. enterica]ECY4705437.1 hypothetical protein [Salmonella enterica subsp. enterica serovar Gaminara]
MKLKKKTMVLILGSALVSGIVSVQATPVVSETNLIVSKPVTMQHTLIARTFSAGEVPENTVLAEGNVAVAGKNIKAVTLAWDRDINPAWGLSRNAQDAVMSINLSAPASQFHVVNIRFLPETDAVSYSDGTFELNSPAGEFRYKIVTSVGAQILNSGRYKLGLLADVVTM